MKPLELPKFSNLITTIKYINQRTAEVQNFEYLSIDLSGDALSLIQKLTITAAYYSIVRQVVNYKSKGSLDRGISGREFKQASI